MKVLQTIQGMSPMSGGPSTCTRDLLEGLYSIHANVDLLTVSLNHNGIHNLGFGSNWLCEVANDYRTPLAFSANIRRFLNESDYDIYHTNGLWMYVNHETCKVARSKRKPYVLSTHGMLYPTALKIKAWKKWSMRKLWFNTDISQASCLHATCEQEMKYIRDFGYKGPIAVIPNPVVFPNGVNVKLAVPSRKIIGYLGRLHPIKKVENLLQGASLAIKNGVKEQFTIEIMGKGSDEYETFLRNEVKRLGLCERVDFVGFVSGMEKYKRLANLWSLFVPSAQENFGMIVPESLICGTPVYASLGTPWKELNEYGCGWWKDNSPETIAEVIKNTLTMEKSKILSMGINGHNLIEEKYEQHKVARQMQTLYQWLLGECDKPEFVYE